MLLELHLSECRTYPSLQMRFGRGCHFCVGPNAVGKTGLVEAISVASLGHSFRTHQLHTLVRRGATECNIRLVFERHGVEQTLRVAIHERQRKAWLNDTPLPALSHLAGQLPLVVLTPQDIELVRGEPHFRRQCIDLHCSQYDPLYHHYLLRYRRALRQRNILLKGRQTRTMGAWEAEMARAAAYLCEQRNLAGAELADAMNQLLPQLVFEAASCHLRYQGPTGAEPPREEELRALWAEHRPKELEIGTTLVGPHRDEWILELDGYPAREFASEGEARTLAAALRLAQTILLREKTGACPLVCIDDFGLGLDPVRFARLMEWAVLQPQVLCTAPSWGGPTPWGQGTLYQYTTGRWQAH